MRAEELASLLSDPDRLAVAGALAAEPGTTAELAERTHREQRAVLAALGELRQAGFVAVGDGTYSLDVTALRNAAAAVAEMDIPMDPAIGYGMTPDEVAVLERYFAGRVLTEFPNNRAKFQIVLQRVALEFDVGRRYTEPEVNEILRVFHADWSTLRRGLVDEGFLDREHVDGADLYWRSGGRVV